MKTIMTGLGPNVNGKDARTALSFFLPWRWHRWRRGSAQREAEHRLSVFLDIPHIFLCDSGRSALVLALKALGIKKGDTVAVQAYTCMVVINAIHHAGGEPLYIDVDEHANMSPADLEKKITSTVQAILIQHTFGVPAQIDALIALAKKHGIGTIEDCAHALGGVHHGRPLGTFADIGMFSFGSDKIISCSRGGALGTRSPKIAARLEEYEKKMPDLPRMMIARYLISFPLFWIGKKWYDFFFIGKALLKASALLGLIPPVITKKEKAGEWPPFSPSRLPNALATILLGQLHDMKKTIEHRRSLARRYADAFGRSFDPDAAYVRYPLFLEHARACIASAKKEKIVLGDWYASVIAPPDSDTQKTCYVMGSCKEAEQRTRLSVNLPTNRWMTLDDTNRIIRFLKSYV